MKSLKANKHNHLTSTYYLLLKKSLVRQNKPYTEAFVGADVSKFSRVR